MIWYIIFIGDWNPDFRHNSKLMDQWGEATAHKYDLLFVNPKIIFNEAGFHETQNS